MRVTKKKVFCMWAFWERDASKRLTGVTQKILICVFSGGRQYTAWIYYRLVRDPRSTELVLVAQLGRQ